MSTGQAVQQANAAPPRPRWTERLWRAGRNILSGGLEPGRAAGAVFIGIFFAIFPIYGFQAIAAVAVARLARVNVPLALAATFLNIPPLQPFLVVGSIAIGHYVRTGSRLALEWSNLNASTAAEHFVSWIIGSLIGGVVAGGIASGVTYLSLRVYHFRRAPAWRKAVDEAFAGCPTQARRFAWFKIRMDRMFDLIDPATLPDGPIVDLGCGYGITLAWAAAGRTAAALRGCDLDLSRVEAARIALARWNADIQAADVREYAIEPASVIFLFDVLQFVSPEEQVDLLRRCCRSLLPGGTLIFRVHQTGGSARARSAYAFDRLIFRVGGCRRRPVILSRAEYRNAVESEGLRVEEIAMNNRLPLAHVIFRATRR